MRVGYHQVMAFGRCGLCREERELRLSHLLPAGAYAIVGDRTAGKHPVYITPGGTLFWDQEVRAPLLCDECEARFNRGGEDWTLENCWRASNEFRLRDALRGAPSVEVEPGSYAFVATEVPGVEMRRLVYFGASVFWRAAARWWRIDKHTHRLLSYGPHEERLRQFLLSDEGSLPEGVALLIGVSVAREGRHNRILELPTQVPDSSQPCRYRFSMPGLTFVLYVGGRLPHVVTAYCASRTGTLLMLPEAEAEKLQDLIRLARETPRRGTLRAVPPIDQA